MPLLTYYNLSDEKKEKIIQASLEEFAFKDYEQASLTGIIKKVGVAKGSFYRYFKNKYDLYAFLIGLSQETKGEETQVSIEPTEDFFLWLSKKYAATVRFSIDHPLQCRLLQNMMSERNSHELENILVKTKRAMLKEILETIEKYQFKGEIRSDIDRDWLGFHLVHQEYAILDYLGFKFQKRIKGHMVRLPLREIETHKVDRVILNFVSMLKQGLSDQINDLSPDLIPIQARRQTN